MQIKSDRIVFPDNTEQFTAGGGSGGGGSVETVDAPAFSASLSAPASMSNTGWTKVPFSVVEYDTENSFDTTNNRFNPSVAGYYKLTFNARFNGNVKSCFGAVYLNGSEKFSTYNSSVKLSTTLLVEGTVYLNGTTDYVEAFVFHGSDTPLDLSNSLSHTYFQGVLVKPANSGTLVGGEPVTLDALGIPNHDKVTVDADGKVSIKIADSGGTADVNADELVLEGTGNMGMNFLTSNTGANRIYFGDSDNALSGVIKYDHNLDSMTFNTSAEERMRIFSNGIVNFNASNMATQPSESNPGFSISYSLTSQHHRSATSSTGGIRHFGFYNPNGRVGGILTNGNGCQLEGFTTRASDVYFSDDEDNPRQGKNLKETLADRDKIIDKLMAKVDALEVKLKKVK